LALSAWQNIIMTKSKRKKRESQKGPRRKRMKRPARLQSAQSSEWVAKFQGKNIVKSYAKWFGVDLLSSIIELRLLGVPIELDRENQIRETLTQKAKAKAAQKKAKKQRETDELYTDSDDTFAFIAGYTSAGFPYGTTWEELGETPPWIEDESL